MKGSVPDAGTAPDATVTLELHLPARGRHRLPPRRARATSTAGFVPLEGPKLPSGYAYRDREPSAPDAEYRAYKYGRKIENGGLRDCCNPFNAGTHEHLAFHNGWHAARAQRQAFREIQGLLYQGAEYVIRKPVRGRDKRVVVMKKPGAPSTLSLSTMKPPL